MFIETHRYGIKDRNWSKSANNTAAIRLHLKKDRMIKNLRLLLKKGSL